VHVFGKGKGVIATKSFLKGDFVCEYHGELITRKEAFYREVRSHSLLSLCLFVLLFGIFFRIKELKNYVIATYTILNMTAGC
jgi:hypothetical protein